MTSKITCFGPVQLITGKNQSRFPYCNSIFIEEAGLIIDPSCNQAILHDLYDRGLISTVCLSHWHEDHFGFLYLLENCPLWLSKEDAVPLNSMAKFLEWYGIDGPDGVHLKQVIADKMENVIRFKPQSPERILRDGEVVDLGSISMEVIASPGHSPGHLSFFFKEVGVLFLGDYNLDQLGPWTGDPYSDIDQSIESIKRLRQVEADILITGHGQNVITGDATNYWEQYTDAIERREKAIISFLSKPRSVDQIIDQWIVLGKPHEPLAYFRFGEKAHIQKHLKRLLKQGEIHKEGDRFVRVNGRPLVND